jgi:hypothetical protein
MKLLANRRETSDLAAAGSFCEQLAAVSEPQAVDIIHG